MPLVNHHYGRFLIIFLFLLSFQPETTKNCQKWRTDATGWSTWASWPAGSCSSCTRATSNQLRHHSEEPGPLLHQGHLRPLSQVCGKKGLSSSLPPRAASSLEKKFEHLLTTFSGMGPKPETWWGPQGPRTARPRTVISGASWQPSRHRQRRPSEGSCTSRIGASSWWLISTNQK